MPAYFPNVQTNLFGQPVQNGLVLGCTSCPANRFQGIKKIKGLSRIHGQSIFIWAQSPGSTENAKEIELIGPSGDLLWSALKHYGIRREDCAIQNVMRCWPHNNGADLETNDPVFKSMLKCCTPFNDEALRVNNKRAVVHVILGDVAGAQLLGKAFRKDTPVFWHEPWNAYVVLNAHPAYILRKGGEKKSGWEYIQWRERFRAVAAILKHPGQFGYVKHGLFNGIVQTPAMLRKVQSELDKESKQGRRISVDIEDGTVNGERKILLIGFGTGRFRDLKKWNSWEGRSWSVVVDHPEAVPYPEKLPILKEILEDASISKTLQNGSYDVDLIWKLLKIRVRGYDYDTRYGTYLRYSFLRSFGLESQTTMFLPEFADYKDMVAPYKGNFAEAPLETLAPYNCADCTATKMLDEIHSPYVKPELIKVYIHTAFTLDRMEPRGPILDWKNWERAKVEIEPWIEELDRKLRHIAEDPEFNADSTPQASWLIYDKLRLSQTELGRTTKYEALMEVARMSKSKVPEMLSLRRALGRIRGHVLKGYAASANNHNGHLATIWWLTGAETGRLRSGRGDEAEAEGICNLQNIANLPILQNMLVSDPNWRKAL